jgi:glycosyltransferase involved in cell wall biosynthesis
MTVIYLYDIEGWALHAIGEWLAKVMAPFAEVDFRIMTSAAWHAAPVGCDVLYLSYSGLVVPGVDYRRWARRVVTTIHDPCEISFFEQRDDWATLPLRPLPLAQVDECSVISRELRDVVERRFGVTARLTPTWSLRAEVLKAARRDPAEARPAIRAMSSTNVPARRPFRDVLRNCRHPAPFLRDERGRISLRQLTAIGIRRRRKRVEWLDRIRADLRDRPTIECDFTTGPAARRSAAEYEAALVASDVYLCTSTMEGGPLPVLEAVMAGAAVLSTRVGQVPDWIEDGGSGFFCATPAEFRDRLIAYDEDRELLRRHQRRARALADAMTPDLHGWRALLTLDGPGSGQS